MKGIYLTEEGKKEIEAKIAELENYTYATQNIWIEGQNSGMVKILEEILSSATILPVEENWRSTNLLKILIEAERTKSGIKVNKAYLTKNKAAMKREIERTSKLKDNDPSAYGKWEADYADKDKKKKYKTKKSAATTAYEKMFGKKNKK
jgi:hypothetical protein